MRKTILLIIFLFIIFEKNQILNSQIINIEDRRAALVDTSGWFGYLGLGANLIKNTKSITTISGNLRLDYLRKKSRFLFLSNYNLIRANKERFIDNGFGHLRMNLFVHDNIEFEIFSQAQFNNQIRLSFRGLLGSGFRFQIYESEKAKIFSGLSYMFEYDEIKFTPESISFFRDHRLNSYFSVRFQPNPTFSFSNTTYYQPILNDFTEVRLSSQTSLKFLISKKLSYTSTFSITNDTRVPDDVPNTYYSWRNGIRLDF